MTGNYVLGFRLFFMDGLPLVMPAESYRLLSAGNPDVLAFGTSDMYVSGENVSLIEIWHLKPRFIGPCRRCANSYIADLVTPASSLLGL